MQSMTEWRSIPDWPEYEVSENGDVRRVAPVIGAPTSKRPLPYLLKPARSSTGYMTFKFTRRSQSTTFHRHRIVALAFLGQPPFPKAEIAHLDGSRSNDHVSNLRWVTHKENEDHKIEHGTNYANERAHNAILSKATVLQMRREFTGQRGEIAAIARKHGIRYDTAYAAIKGRNWQTFYS